MLNMLSSGALRRCCMVRPSPHLIWMRLSKFSSANADRLIAALAELDARYRGHTPPSRPTKKDVLAGGHLLLVTSAGPLDVLAFIEPHEGFRDLHASFESVTFEGYRVKILALDELIRQKRWMGRDKEQTALRMLEALKASKVSDLEAKN
jgi:hypothetical protein